MSATLHSVILSNVHFICVWCDSRLNTNDAQDAFRSVRLSLGRAFKFRTRTSLTCFAFFFSATGTVSNIDARPGSLLFLLFMIGTQEIRTILSINRPQVNELFYIEQLNSGTHCQVRSLLQTACVLSKRNLENSFLNHFLSARRVTYWCFYILLWF